MADVNEAMNAILDELKPYVYLTDLSTGVVQITLGMKHDERGPYTECAVLRCPKLAEQLHARMSALTEADNQRRNRMNNNLEKIAVAIRLFKLAQQLAEDALTEIGTTTEPDVSYPTYKKIKQHVEASRENLAHAITDLRSTRNQKEAEGVEG